jgi:hypothetical protein
VCELFPRSLAALTTRIALAVRNLAHPPIPPRDPTDRGHAAYAFPNDTAEQERLELQGECIKRLLDDRLYLAPLSTSRPPRAILDVATGVGDWAIQIGDLFPTSTVIGTDLSPIQPAEVPPNVHFFIEDS